MSMGIDYARLKSWPFAPVEHRYNVDDAIRYALAIGLGADPVDERQLAFVDDTASVPRVLPTMAVVLGYAGPWMTDPAAGIDYSMILHGEERATFERPLPPEGAVTSKHRVTHVVDKGAGRGAVIGVEKELFDAGGTRLATLAHIIVARANGGFSSPNGGSDAPPAALPRVPDRQPDRLWEFRTLPQQALMYRLCGDRNPLHSHPPAARKAGFERPILHGLCTYGIAGHALLAAWCGYDESKLKSLACRFSAPVIPGELLRFEMYDEGAEVAFRARAVERDKVVLDYGRAAIA